MKYLFLFATHLGLFVVGVFVSSHFKFDKPIETYRWVIVGLIIAYNFVLFVKEGK